MSPRVSKPVPQQAATSAIQDKFQTTAKELKAALIERDDEIDISLTAIVCHEHVCLQGRPGTGKSWLFDNIMLWFDGPTYSELMQKDLPTDTVFGPLDIPQLLGETTPDKKSRYVRLTKGYVPEAVLMFLDEIWKSGPAVLNRNLKIMNERVFMNGNIAVKVPLVTCFAASNEWPSANEGGKELGALLDRFLLRKNILPVQTRAGRERLLFDRNLTPQLSTRITEQEIRQARLEALALPWTDKAKETLLKILDALAKEGIVPGDRRQRKAYDVAAAAAYIAGDTQVIPEHLEILQHVLWDDPVEQPEKAGQIVRKLANPHGAEISGLLMEFQQITDAMDFTDINKMAASQKKLKEIQTKLESLKETPKQKAALDLVQGRMKDIMRKAFEQMQK